MGFNWSGYQWQKDMQARLNNAIGQISGKNTGTAKNNHNGNSKSKKY